ncbi:hypothetical protein ACG3M1_09270 [Clostridium sp. C45]|uniref:hypothetical protein n=1 Tax=Clostridium sp. 10cd* TaxID=3373596 RepID=UPI0037C17BC4
MLQEKLNISRVLMAEVSQNKQKDNEHQIVVRKNNTFFDAYAKHFIPIIKGYVICNRYKHINFSDKTEKELEKVIEDTKSVFDNKVVTGAERYRDHVKKLREQMETEWKLQTDEFLAGIKEELGILKLISNEKQEINRILQYMNNFSSWPTDENASKAFDEAKRKADDILSQMEFDSEIADFLRKVKDRNASLLDLTDSIIDWIRKENLSSNIMLSIKN